MNFSHFHFEGIVIAASWNWTIFFKICFLHFSLTCLDMFIWNFVCDFIVMNFMSSLSFVNFCKSCAFFESRIFKKYSFLNFSPTWFDLFSRYLIIISLCCYLPQIIFNCRQFLYEYCPFFNLHSFPQLSPACFDICSWNFVYNYIVCTSDRVHMSTPSIIFLKELLIMLSWNLVYHFIFLMHMHESSFFWWSINNFFKIF